MKQYIQKHLDEHEKVLEHLRMHMIEPIAAVAALMVDILLKGNKILVMGNGGSAADAQHFAAELVNCFLVERRPLPAIALTTDSSVMTAIGNDYSFEKIFSRQVSALAQQGDLVIGLSTSGNSLNILDSLKVAGTIGAVTLSLVGNDGGKIKAITDHCLCIPSQYTPVIQEAHITILHILCDLVEKKMFGGVEI